MEEETYEDEEDEEEPQDDEEEWVSEEEVAVGVFAFLLTVSPEDVEEERHTTRKTRTTRSMADPREEELLS